MNNSRWIANRIGLVDFWYYGDQEYEFLDGRILLRGANGSGKSVTMQSFIPLLLDGNMRPERLDPFGSKARKMENYLLEEDDSREERTGYLYMEFKRAASETYLTFGMGIRARKSKKLETWYFYLQDGRRIGRDFLLYKEGIEKLVLTKTELKHRLGNGGQVFESRGEYEKCVNELLFGFETVEEYRELLSLLIQLRTPKLSKDFKPSVINEILSRSLQTLSEDDLRPLSEAIENMDNLETNLHTLEDCEKAAKDIKTVYDKYNKAVLLEKAEVYIGAEQAYRKSKKESELLERDLEQKKQNLNMVNEQRHTLENEQKVLKEEYDSLRDSDAAKLKEREIVLAREEVEYKNGQLQREERIGRKREELRDKEYKQKEYVEESEKIWSEISQHFAEITDYMAESAFTEWQFMIREMMESKEKSYDFIYHAGLLRDYQKQVQSGLKVLEREEDTRKKYGDAMQEMDGIRERREQREREWQQYEGLVREQKGELTEAVHVWSKQNELLLMDSPTLQQIDRAIEAFAYEDDYSEIRELVAQKRQEVKDVLSDRVRELEGEKECWDAERKRISAEIAALEQAEEVEPERSEEVIKSRAQLADMGIPVQPFYKMIDFSDEITNEQRNSLEAALYDMGVLDALVVSPDYREQILAMDRTVCDKYLFADATALNGNLMELFFMENADDDIILCMQIQNILSGIGYGVQKNAGAWIAPDGHYGIGILEGTVSSGYAAKYVGAAAREKHRQECIAGLCQEMQFAEGEWNGRCNAIQKLSGQLEQLHKEYQSFPGVEDLRAALKSSADAKHLWEQAQEDVKRQRIVLQEWEQKLQEIQIQVQEICGKTGLPTKLTVYQQEHKTLEDYQSEFQEVEREHNRYLTDLSRIEDVKERIEGLQMDIDALLSDQNKDDWRLRECQTALQSVREQLKLTDYEKIRERLDYCVERLDSQSGIPRELNEASKRQGQLETEIQNGTERIKKASVHVLHCDSVRKQWEKIFSEEYKMGYVECDFIWNEDIYDMAGKVQMMLHGQMGKKTKQDLFGDLQGIYHEKRGILSEYQLMIQNNVFGELARIYSVEQPEGRDRITRIDIKAKYRGVDMPFMQLVSKLHADVEELTNLLGEKDRELFEDLLSNTISKKIRMKIQESNRWVENMNRMMESMETSSGLTLSLKWKPRQAEKEGQLDTRELVELLQMDAEIMRQEDIDKISGHFRASIREVRKLSKEEFNIQSFHVIMKEILDYRKWFEFQLYFQKTGEKKKEMTDRMFFTFSGGEKAMSMYVPLFSAVVAKYRGADENAPRIISLDEAFAGVDEMNIKDMFRLMIQLELNFMINSQVLWGDYDTVPSLAIYHLIRPQNAKCVTVMKYIWNGKIRTLEGTDG